MKLPLFLLCSFSLLTVTAQQNYWQQSYPTGSGNSVVQTSDGGYLMAGINYGPGCVGDRSALLLKTDSLGQQQWRQCYTITSGSGTSGPNHVFHTVLETATGYIAAGSWGGTLQSYHPLLTKTDRQGNPLWSVALGGIATDGYCREVKQMPNGNLVVAGTLEYPDRGFLALLDSMGNQIWMQTFTEPGKQVSFNSVSVMSDSSFLLSGMARSSTFGYTWVAKVGWQGNLIWKKTGTVPGLQGWITSGEVLSGDGLVMGGNVPIPPTSIGIRFWLAKVDTSGNLVWSIILPDSSGAIADIAVTPTGEMYATGYLRQPFPSMEFNVALLKLDPQGNLLWMRSLGTNQRQEDGYSLFLTNDGGVIITGRSSLPGSVGYSQDRAVLYKLDGNGELLWVSDDKPVNSSQFAPNPFKEAVSIALLPEWKHPYCLIYDQTGRLVAYLKPTAQGKLTWHRVGQPAGIYFYRIATSDGSLITTGKIVAE